MSNFNNTSTSNEVLEGINLKGKTVLVTGGSGGLGKETARAMASRGAQVTIVALESELENLNDSATEIEKSTGQKVEIGTIDLSKPDSIKQFAKSWLEKHNELDILINNAGVLSQKLARTSDGIELNFAVNFLGHFLLTNLLLPALKTSGNARVVNLSTSGHRMAAVNFDDINFEKTEFDRILAYAAAKTAVLWFSNEFDRKYKTSNIRSYALHPGAIAATGLNKESPKEHLEAYTEQLRKEGKLKTVEQGAATTCWAATSKELDGTGGIYLEDCNIVTFLGDPDNMNDLSGYAPHSFDEVSEKRLWNVANEMLNTNF